MKKDKTSQRVSIRELADALRVSTDTLRERTGPVRSLPFASGPRSGST